MGAKINPTSGQKALFLGVFGIALVVRLIHNNYMLENPLYYMPLGGHLPSLEMAEKIAAGDILPFDRPFSQNTPLYPYILALEYLFTGTGNLFAARLFGIMVDSLTCAMIAVLATRHFSLFAGLVSGMITAFYGPMIFYSAELIVVPYTLFFVTLGILLLDMNGGIRLYMLSGLILGLAVGTRPDLIILAIPVICVSCVMINKGRIMKTLSLSAGILIAIMPISMANYAVSGKFILLTTSAGHNFYIGHNPSSTAGYTLSESLDGDIFLNMKRLAEKTEGKEFADNEVSQYYFKKAMGHIINDPIHELRITGKKALAAINDHEATTYADYYFQEEFSPVLRYSIGLGMLFPLAALGIIVYYRRYLLLTPVVASFLTIIMFFYVARFRMPAIPFLAIFAGGAVSAMIDYIRDLKKIRILVSFILVVCFFLISNIKLVEVDSSNEWNKAGVVLRVNKKYEEAEKALLRARQENPSNPNTYLNLGVLYNIMGDTEESKKMYSIGERLRK